MARGSGRSPFRAAILLVPLLILACRSLPAGAPKPPRVRVDPGGDDRPHRISATVLPVREETFRETLNRGGVGLRIAGERQDLVLRFANLDPAAEDLVLRTFEVPDGSFSEPEGFSGEDVIVVETLTGSPPTGFTMHVLPGIRDGELDGLEVGVLVRPVDGTLLPVLRGRLPVKGSGAVLVTGESPGRRPFAVVLRLELEGAGRSTAANPPDSHRMRITSWSGATAAFERFLVAAELPEKGGAGGVAVYRIGAGDLRRVETALAEETDAGATEERELDSGTPVTWALGERALEIVPDFSLADYTYRTSIRIEGLPDAEATEETHGERDALLVLGWDAVAVGRTRAVLIRLSPVE